jgi:hypothetical protein
MGGALMSRLPPASKEVKLKESATKMEERMAVMTSSLFERDLEEVVPQLQSVLALVFTLARDYRLRDSYNKGGYTDAFIIIKT